MKYASESRTTEVEESLLRNSLNLLRKQKLVVEHFVFMTRCRIFCFNNNTKTFSFCFNEGTGFLLFKIKFALIILLFFVKIKRICVCFFQFARNVDSLFSSLANKGESHRHKNKDQKEKGFKMRRLGNRFVLSLTVAGSSSRWHSDKPSSQNKSAASVESPSASSAASIAEEVTTPPTGHNNASTDESTSTSPLCSVHRSNLVVLVTADA